MNAYFVQLCITASNAFLQAAAHPPADPDPDIQALVAAKALADGDIVQYRIPLGQGSDSATPAAAAGMEAPASGSLGSSSACGGTPSVRSSGHDPVLASAVVSQGSGARPSFWHWQSRHSDAGCCLQQQQSVRRVTPSC